MASSSRARAAVIATGILIATPVAAQDTPPPPPAGQAKPAEPPPPPVRPMSQQPSALQSPPPPRRAPKPGAAPHGRGKGRRGTAPPAGASIVGAPTFHRLDDGSTRISVEVSSKTDIAESRAQGRLVYRIRAAYVAERVNRLPLMTGYFATPVERAQLTQDGPDVDLVIDLRGGTAPAHRVVETPRGIVLQVDFPRVPGAGEKAFDAPKDSSQERAKRRAGTQTLGSGAHHSDDNN